MSSFDKDDNDNLVESYPFMAGILLVLLISFFIATIKRVFHEVPFSDEKKYNNCKCKKCLERYEKFKKITKKENFNCMFYFYLIFLLLSLFLFSLLCYKITTTKKKVFDPYEILDIPQNSEISDVKKEYKKLVRKYHPDKSKEKNAKEIFIEITKAYKALTDEKAMENYKKYGHPDGPSYMRISFAIPFFLLKGKVGGFILFSFALFVVLILPIIFIRWYNNSKKFNESGMLCINQSIFYYFLNPKVQLCNLPFILGLSNEFSQIKVNDEQLSKIKEIIHNKYEKYFAELNEEDKEQFELEIPRGNYKAILVLYEHCYNSTNDIINEEDKMIIFKKCKLLIDNIINCWHECVKLKEIIETIKLGEIEENADYSDIKEFTMETLEKIISFSQCLYQRTNISLENYQGMQIPYITKDISNKIKSIKEIQQDTSILKSFLKNENEYKEAVMVVNSFPSYEIEDKVKIEDFDQSTKFLEIFIKINKTSDKNNDKVNGFNHSLTYPFPINYEFAIVLSDNKTKKIEFINNFSIEDNEEIEFNHRIVCEENEEKEIVVDFYPLNYCGLNMKKVIKVSIKGLEGKVQKTKKFKGLDFDLDFFFDKYCQPIPYIKHKESNSNEHIKKE